MSHQTEWEMTFDEIRNKALAYYENKADVHSETNFVAILNAFEMFKTFIATLIAEEREKILSEYGSAFSKLIDSEFVGKEEAVLKAEMAWKELLDKAIKKERTRVVEILEGMIPKVWFPGGQLALKRKFLNEALLAINVQDNGKSN